MGFVITKPNKKERLPAGQSWVQISPKFWFEWGDEPLGMVSTAAYDKWGDYHYTGLRPIEIKKSIQFHNPHS